MGLLMIYCVGLVLTFISSGTVVAFSKEINKKSALHCVLTLMVTLMLSAVWFITVPILVSKSGRNDK